jgi:hypothetical protein
MNLQHILGEIEKVDGDVCERLDTRRTALKNFRNIGTRLALTAVPFALGSFFKKSYAQTSNTSQIISILNYALTLEYLEAEFYQKGVTNFAAIGVPAGAAQAAISTISAHETAHVTFLTNTVKALGGTPATKPTFDFTGGKGVAGAGPFQNVFSNYATFLAVSQTFEDTGVRAYKGRASELVQTGDILTAALRIHSVEARHAAHIRSMRQAAGQATGTVKPWITQNQSGIGSTAVQASYNGEELVTQGGVAITNINGTGISADAASESFDEPLAASQVLTIINPFIVG